ncbi:MAG: DUF933 domain-containing protein [Candidatus Margulisbacteria bacterium]|nr:DUF933 domain-containing protein [Candidatus Margulisiibacteriota bacterium]
MKVTIVGLPQSGQQQLFSILTGIPLETIQQKPLEMQQGICEVKDIRVTTLKKIYNPKKTTYARIEYLLLPDFNLQGPAKAAILTQLKNADELCYVARSENAASAVNSFLAELVINDLLLIEKRLGTIAKEQKKKPTDQAAKEKQLMELCQKQLEAEKPLQQFDFSEEQRKILRAYQFLTLKPLILVVNVPEDRINENNLCAELSHGLPYPCVQLSVELEQEISYLDETDRLSFMKEMGIAEPAIDKMTCLAFAGLGLISFFTVGEDEVRAWPVRKGALAPEAGSVIHSDIAKGFVRAEMCKYDDLIAAGSEAKLKEQGKYYLKGKDYQVEGGDILSFRFNV